MRAGLDKSLQEIEHGDWGDPADAFSVARRVRELRRIPVRELKADEIAVLLRQQVGLPTLMPLALDILEAHGEVSDEMYPGELILSAMQADNENHWHDIPAFRRRLATLVEGGQFHSKKAKEWLAHPDIRTDRQKRKQREQLRAWWIKLGGEDIIA